MAKTKMSYIPQRKNVLTFVQFLLCFQILKKYYLLIRLLLV